jgi:hypothetical protein
MAHIQKAYRFTPPLTRAITKAAHHTEKTQNQFVSDVLAAYIDSLGDEALCTLVDQHYAAETEAEENRKARTE